MVRKMKNNSEKNLTLASVWRRSLLACRICIYICVI